MHESQSFWDWRARSPPSEKRRRLSAALSKPRATALGLPRMRALPTATLSGQHSTGVPIPRGGVGELERGLRSVVCPTTDVSDGRPQSPRSEQPRLRAFWVTRYWAIGYGGRPMCHRLAPCPTSPWGCACQPCLKPLRGKRHGVGGA